MQAIIFHEEPYSHKFLLFYVNSTHRDIQFSVPHFLIYLQLDKIYIGRHRLNKIYLRATLFSIFIYHHTGNRNCEICSFNKAGMNFFNTVMAPRSSCIRSLPHWQFCIFICYCCLCPLCGTCVALLEASW